MFTACAGNASSQFEPNATLGWLGTPDERFVRRVTSFDDRDVYTHDADGFRTTPQTGNDTFVVLGDSLAYGWMADDNTTFPSVLDAWSPEHRVLNLAQAGYGTGQEFLLYRDVADRVDHDLVIVAYFPNDPRDNVGVDASGDPVPKRPVVSVDNGTIEWIQRPQLPNTTSDTTGEHSQTDQSTNGSTQPSDGEAGLLGNPVVESVQRFLDDHTLVYQFLASRTVSVLEKAGVVDSVGLQLPSPSERDRRLRMTGDLLQAIGERASEEGADVLYMPIPPRGEINPARPWIYPPDAYAPYWRDQKATVEEVANRSASWNFLDPQPALEEARSEGTRVYGIDDVHLTEPGYQVVAQAIHTWLVDSRYIEPGSTPDVAEAQGTCSTG